MDKNIRSAQKEVLRVFAKKAKVFALAGGTALELYYLKHRFSADLDFFSPEYDLSEINGLIAELAKFSAKKPKLESEFMAGGRARVRFYSLSLKNYPRPLKIDFVEDVLLDKPRIKIIDGLRIYAVEDIYLHKIFAIAGIERQEDDIGRQITRGRNEARDVFDVYWLSKKIKPLHLFLKNLSPQLQRGMVHWYRSFSRYELKTALMDLDIYDKKFDSKALIQHMEREIQQLIKEKVDLE